MKNQFKFLTIVAGILLIAFNANAVQRDITVTADIDPTVDLTLSNGLPIPSLMQLQYLPGKGLASHKENIKFWSNIVNRALNVSLANMPSLTDANGSHAIPLSVSINGQKLTTSATILPYATTFPSGINNGSSTMPLVIEQNKPEPVSAAGIYSGIVSLVVTQSTAASGG